MSEHSAPSDLALAGNIDHLSVQELRGWACLKTPSGSEGQRDLQLVVDGHVVAQTTADGRRDDVHQQLGLSAWAGFSFNLGEELLVEHGGQAFSIVDAASGANLAVEDRALPALTQRILVDVGDVMHFLLDRGIATGIQRVVTEVGRVLSGLDDVSIVAGSVQGTGIYEVEPFLWQRVLESFASSPDSVRKAAEHLLAASTSKAPIRATHRDVLVVLGAPWISEEYLQSAVGFRQDGGVVITLIYDLIPIRLPHMVDDHLREVFTRFLVTTCAMSDGVLCISEYTRRDFENYCAELGLEAPPTKVTRLASAITDGGAPSRGLAPSARPLVRAGSAGYVALISTIEGRKGHALLLRVWTRLVRELGAERVPELVFVGRPGWRAQDVYSELSRTGYLDGKVHVISRASDDELAAIYAGAQFTVYPSTFEGWGLPVAESLTCGTPVVASDSSSIPEVGGEAVTYFPSGDEQALFVTVHELVTSTHALAKARAAAASYEPDTWEQVAECVVEMAKQVSVSDHRVYAPSAAVGIEMSFEHGQRRQEHNSFLEASWEEQLLRAGPILRQPPHVLSEVLGVLALSGDVVGSGADGRWIRDAGTATVRLRLPDDRPAVLYVNVSAGTDHPSALVDFRGDCRPESAWCSQSTTVKLLVHPRPDGVVEILVQVQRRSPLEDRPGAGVRLRSAVWLDSSDMSGQLFVAEVQAGIRSRSKMPD